IAISILTFTVLISCTSHFEDVAKKKIISVTFKNVSSHGTSKVLPGAKVPPTTDSYSLGYSNGCWDGSHAYLNITHIVPSNVNMEDYFSGYYTGYRTCLIPPTGSGSSGGGGADGGPGCISVYCTIDFDPETNEAVTNCSVTSAAP